MVELDQLLFHHPSRILYNTNFMLYSKMFCDLPTLVIISKSVLKAFPDIVNILPKNHHMYCFSGTQPDIEQIQSIPINSNVRQIIGMGGGSVLDIAKACTARLLARNQKSIPVLLDDSNVLTASGKMREQISLFLVTSILGSCSEFTATCSVWDKQNNRKRTLAHEFLYADYAIHDTMLCQTVTTENRLITALDCLSHAVESCWNKNSTPITNHLAYGAIKILIDVLPKLNVHGTQQTI